MDILSQIIKVKQARLAAAKNELPGEQLYEQAWARRQMAKPHALVSALDSSTGMSIIAEFKRRSPSKGEIRSTAQPAKVAHSYQRGGARAISVLTEQDHFAGLLEDLVDVREAVTLPILRKDFIFDPYQVYESAASGADALLLIVSALDDHELKDLRRITEDDLGMDAVIEVHSEEEMRRAVAVGAKLIGVNNRDLRTFSVSIEVSIALAGMAPSGTMLISESGLNSATVLQELKSLGYKGFLIGESLMRSENPELALRALLEGEASESAED